MQTYIHAVLRQRRSHARLDTHQVSLRRKHKVDEYMYN